MFKKILSFTFIYLFIFHIFNNNSFASNDNSIYMIKNIPVEAKSDNATKAKDIALKAGQRKALKALFQKGGIDQTYTKFINDSLISEMVETIKVLDEVMTTKSYSSNLTILFNREFLNFNLKKMSIGVNKITDNIFLYIPLFEDEQGNINIIDSKNIWYETAYNEYFENSNKYSNIVIIDNYNLSNAGLLPSTKDIKSLNYDSFQTVLNKYNSNTVVLSIAKYIKQDDLVEIRFKEIDAEKIDKRILNFSNKNELSPDELMKEASVKTLEFLNNESQTRILEARKNEKELAKIKKNNYIDVFYVIPNIKEYIYIKKLINNLDFITKYETLQLTTKMANIRLYYKGDESEIIPLFSNKGFVISSKYGKFFIDYKGL